MLPLLVLVVAVAHVSCLGVEDILLARQHLLSLLISSSLPVSVLPFTFSSDLFACFGCLEYLRNLVELCEVADRRGRVG